MKTLPALLLLALTSVAHAALPEAAPAQVGLAGDRLDAIAPLVQKAVSDNALPGAVVLIGRHGKVSYARAFGDRCVEPDREPMTRETIFDLASLTKPVATACAAMVLLDQGKLQLDDPLRKHLPEFDNHDKGAITVDQLLRHRAGFIADNAISDFADGPEAAWKRMADCELRTQPGERFVYSDVGFMVLGRLVERVSGQPLDAFCRSAIYEPLGMTDTTFAPRGFSWADRLSRVAPTTREGEGGTLLRGTVHDPRARALGGVAGHAGLFGTADDLAVFAQMLLNEGVGASGQRVLKAETVRRMIDPAETPARQRRGLGWDMATGYSAPKGTKFGPRSFGHTGFTGTSIWIDPDTDCFVILLTSRVHPDGKAKAPTSLRSQLATIVAEAVVDDAGGRPSRVGEPSDRSGF